VEIREKLKEAYKTLIDSKAKRQYIFSMREDKQEKEIKKSKAMHLFNDGMVEFRAGNYEKARTIFKEAIRNDPNSPVYYSMLESITKEERQSNSAKFFQAGIMAYKQKNDLQRAIKLIKKAISLSPGVHAGFHLKLAEIQSNRPETRRDAIKNYEIAIEAEPGNHDLKITLADFLYTCGMKQDAANKYREILKWIPENPRVRKALLALKKEGILPKKRKERDSEDDE